MQQDIIWIITSVQPYIYLYMTMSLADVSFIPDDQESRPTFHMLAVDRYSRTRGLSQAGDSVHHRFDVGGYTWCFDFYPSGDSEENRDYVCFSIYLARGSRNTAAGDDPLKMHIDIECTFINPVDQQKVIGCQPYDRHGSRCSFRVKREIHYKKLLNL
jgi:hypothetical protein